jgi:hypothetical protein
MLAVLFLPRCGAFFMDSNNLGDAMQLKDLADGMGFLLDGKMYTILRREEKETFGGMKFSVTTVMHLAGMEIVDWDSGLNDIEVQPIVYNIRIVRKIRGLWRACTLQLGGLQTSYVTDEDYWYAVGKNNREGVCTFPSWFY